MVASGDRYSGVAGGCDKDARDNAVTSLCEFQVNPLDDDSAVLARLVVQGAGDMKPSGEIILDPDYALALASDLRRAAEQVIKVRQNKPT